MGASTTEAAARSAAGTVAAPAAKCLDLNLYGELEGLVEKANEEKQKGRAGIARTKLLSHPDLRLTLIYLTAGAQIEEHYNPGRIIVHTISGHIRMHAAGKSFDLPVGAVLSLDRAVPHDVEALEESAFLLTVVPPAE